MKKHLLLIALLFFAFSTLLYGQTTYPLTSYQLSVDGKTLLNWNGPETEINLATDPAFNALTTISTLAFKDNLRITSVTIPNSVTAIEPATFSNCHNLQSCTLPNTLTAIPDQLFLCCYKLTTVNLPNTLQSIGNDAFNSCHLLTSLTFPNAITTIGNAAFVQCKGLTAVSLPTNLTTMGQNIFEGCENITAITIPNGVTVIPPSAFSGCKKLATVNLHNGITIIAASAFHSNAALTQITLPSNLTTLGSHAFYKSGLTSINMPSSITTMGGFVFSECRNLTTANFPTNATLNYIPFNTFSYTKLTNFTIPNTVVRIAQGAFTASPLNDTVNIPQGITNIELAAFSLTSVKVFNIPATTTIMGENPFAGACVEINVDATNPNYRSINGVLYSKDTTRLIAYPPKKTDASFTVPTDVKIIGAYAFRYALNLQQIVLPNGLESIERYAFNRTGITSITIPPLITSLEPYLFWTSPNLTTVTIPAATKTINDGVFLACPNFATINIDPANTYLASDNGVLYNAARDTLILYPPAKTASSYTVPAGVKTIIGSAFSSNTFLTTVSLPQSLTYLGGYAFQGCTSLTSVIVPSSVTSLSSSVFERCTSLQSVELGNQVNTFGYGVFLGCTALKKIVLPATVTNMSYNVFYGCTGLDTVECKNPIPPTIDITFNGLDQSRVVLRVPIGSRATYQTHNSQWRNFYIIAEKDFLNSAIWFQPTQASGLFNVGLNALSDNTNISVDWGNGDINNNYTLQGPTTTNAISGNLQGALSGVPPVRTLRLLGDNAIGGIDLSNTPLVQFNAENCHPLLNLNLNNTQVSIWNLQPNTALQTLSCTHNNFSSLPTLSKNTALKRLNCSHNNLTELNIATNTQLKSLICNNNRIAALNMSAHSALDTLVCSHNQLTALTLAVATLKKANVEYNALKMSQLPNKAAATLSSDFTYSPQRRYTFPNKLYATGEAINLSAETGLKGVTTTAQATTYKWKTTAGATLQLGVDYREDSAGIFKFIRAIADSVYCEMSSAAYPNLLSYTIDGRATDTVYRSGNMAIRQSDHDKYFITVWKSDNPSASTGNSNTRVILPIRSSNPYNLIWTKLDAAGDETATTDTIRNIAGTADYLLNLSTPGVGSYRIRIMPGAGSFSIRHILVAADPDKLLRVEQWGIAAWSSMQEAFHGCVNMDLTATDIPNLTNVSNMSDMFCDCSSLVGNATINNWDVSSVTNMSSMFRNATAFNQPLNSWNVENVTDMNGMFQAAAAFNQPLSNWNVSKVTNMFGIFERAVSFNQPLNSWEVGNATNMADMFHGAAAFNQPLHLWNVNSVTYTNYMFEGASAFNYPLGNWNLSSITDMSSMLDNCGMDCRNYSTTLSGWAGNASIPSDITLGASGRVYNLTAQAARNTLTTAKNWTINGDSYDKECGIVIINMPDSLKVSITPDTTICSGNSIKVKVKISGGTQPWNIDYPSGPTGGENVEDTDGTDDNTFIYEFNSGILTNSILYNSTNVKVKDKNNCPVTYTITSTVTVNTTPPPTASSPQTFCVSATISDLIVTGDNIKWYNSKGILLTGTTVLINDTTYYATQTINGCESERTAVKVKIVQSVDFSYAFKNVSCKGNKDAKITVTMDEGKPPYTLELYKDDVLLADKTATNITDPTHTFNDLSPGSYRVKVIDSNGCETIKP